MKYCQNCGRELADEAVVCVHCGRSVTKNAAGTDPNDAPNIGYAVLGFFIPLVGLILYLIWKDSTPLRAKSAGKGALFGVIVSFALAIIFALLYIVLIVGIMSSLM